MCFEQSITALSEALGQYTQFKSFGLELTNIYTDLVLAASGDEVCFVALFMCVCLQMCVGTVTLLCYVCVL